jgi:hypothetical protein
MAAAGDPDPLAGMVRSKNPSGEYARARLASWIAVKPRRKRGRKPNPAVIETAETIEFIKREVRAAGRKIYKPGDPSKSIGHEEIVEMVLSVRAANGLDVPKQEAVENYLRRPPNSRAKKSDLC